MAGLVQYYVMKRPKHPKTGEIIRGKTAGATKNADNSINPGATLWFPKELTTAGANGSLMSTSAPSTEVELAQMDGEPWILHSVHFNTKEAIAAASTVVSAVGSENVRILQSIAHELNLTIV